MKVSVPLGKELCRVGKELNLGSHFGGQYMRSRQQDLLPLLGSYFKRNGHCTFSHERVTKLGITTGEGCYNPNEETSDLPLLVS